MLNTDVFHSTMDNLLARQCSLWKEVVTLHVEISIMVGRHYVVPPDFFVYIKDWV